MSDQGFVYFIAQQNNEQKVKIGYSKNPTKRLKSLSTSSPSQLILLGYFEGTMQDEQETHLRFSKDRENLEWFKLSDEILQFVNKVNLLNVYCDFDDKGIIRKYNKMKNF